MEININYPSNDQFVEDLILQRTGPFIKYGGAPALKVWSETGRKTQLLEHLIKNKLIGTYVYETTQEISREVDELIEILPNINFENIVSIGPGNGILELLLLKKITFSEILLIDIEDSDTYQHGFSDNGSGYASLQKTKEFLISNDIPADRILTCNPRHSQLPNFPFDLLISILSMGFHYPCNDYVTFIIENISADGRVVFDKRRGSVDAGFDQILRKFLIKKQTPSEKSDRVFLSGHET